MKRIFLFFALILLTIIPFGIAMQSWDRPVQPPASGDLKAVLPHPLDPGRLLVASRSQVFEKIPSGSWKNIWQSGTEEIRRLLFFKELPDSFFVLTSDGAYRCKLNRYGCQAVYKGLGTEKSVISFAIYPGNKDHWFIGTHSGLLESDDAGKTWFRFQLKRKPVSVLRFSGNRLFMSLGDVLYVSDDLAHFRPIFSIPTISLDTENFPEDSFEEGEFLTADSAGLFDLLVPEEIGQPLWLGTRDGVFESRDGGQNWMALTQSGLRSPEARFLAYSVSTHQLFAGTPAGVYVYQENGWRGIFEGLAKPDIYGLAVIPYPKETLVALTPEGFMDYPVLPDNVKAASALPAGQLNLFRVLIQSEPSVRDIQRAVARFSNLKNGKIKRWQTASRVAALVPTLSFGRDFGRSNNIDIDRGSTSEADNFIQGPADIDNSWDARLSWDFADFIWSSNQTSIDSREKLMVELRNDFLAEATRIYFERRRLQMDFIFNPATTPLENFDKLLRIDELTGLLDGMSGGWMSKQLEKIYKTNEELSRLWEYGNPQI